MDNRVLNKAGTISLIACASLAGAVIGAWELLVTRTASMLFFYDVTYLILAVCLAAIAAGALVTRHIQRAENTAPWLLFTVLLVLTPACWWPLYYAELAWSLGLFALPFSLFGVLSVVIWRRISNRRHRTVLYALEITGALVGLLYLGPLAVSVAPVNVLGDIGVRTHLKETVAREGLVSLETYSDSYARTDILETEKTSVRYFFTDGMFVTRAVAWDGRSAQFEDPHVEQMAGLKRLAFRSSPIERVALLGAGAGFDVAVALQEGAGSIDAVEINAVTIDKAADLDAWSGGVFTSPKVTVHRDDARHFMNRTDQLWDHINLTLLQTSPAAVRGRQHIDARVLTREAVQTYIERLESGGVISIIQNTDRLAAATEETLLEIFEQENILRFESNHEGPFSHLLLASPSPFSPQEIRELQRGAENIDAHMVKTWINGPAPAIATDDRPYLFESGTGFNLQALLLSAMAIFLLMIWGWTARHRSHRVALSSLALLTGIATFAVQMLVIYHCQSALGLPTVSYSIALASVLGGAGLGVLLLGNRVGIRMAGLLALIGCSCLLLLTRAALDVIADSGHVTLLTFTLFTAMSLPLGLPFVSTMNHASTELTHGEGVVIGFDGIGSLLAATGGTAIAMGLGFSALAACTVAVIAGFTLLAFLKPETH